jgi:predicted lipoprotein with Yx(FWY)xxD motif
MSRVVQLVCLLAALAVAIAGCGDGSDSSDTRSSAPAPTATTEDTAADEPEKGAWGVVFGAEGEPFGIILYDNAGYTLYTFSKDKGGTSSCYGACERTWPPALTEGKPRAEGEAIGARVGTTKRKDGTVQLTYAGHPLYTYSRDRSAVTKGHGVHAFGGDWYAIRPSGAKP